MTTETVIDPKMLSILVCPKTRAPLTYDSETHELISKKEILLISVKITNSNNLTCTSCLNKGT